MSSTRSTLASLATTLAALATCGLGACLQSPDAEGCDEPLGVSTEPLSSVSCDARADVGYRSGTPFDITVVTVDGRPVERATANAYYVMAEAASRAGVEIRIVSGFRTMAEQEYFYHCYTSCSCNGCNLAARPGYSNHQSGHALDLNTSAPGVLTWLNAHGAEYGFERTVPSEAWHWEWWGGGPGGGPCAACRAHCEGTVIVGADCGRGDCAAYGSRCVDDALGARCAFYACPDVGDTTVCIDERTIGNCHDGAVSAGDCSAYAAVCSTAGVPAARCVSIFCVGSATDVPVEHDICLPDGRAAHCDANGAPIDAHACDPGTTCVVTGSTGRCQAPGAPSGPEPTDPEPSDPEPMDPAPDPTDPTPTDPSDPDAPDPDASAPPGDPRTPTSRGVITQTCAVSAERTAPPLTTITFAVIAALALRRRLNRGRSRISP